MADQNPAGWTYPSFIKPTYQASKYQRLPEESSTSGYQHGLDTIEQLPAVAPPPEYNRNLYNTYPQTDVPLQDLNKDGKKQGEDDAEFAKSTDQAGLLSMSRPQTWKEKHLSGWRYGAVSCAMSVTTVFMINLSATIWAVSKKTGGPGGRLLLYEGDCTRLRPLNAGVHFLINALSTLLLSSSNYCMQCLSAPTRREVDKAHASRVWMDIGIPSFRNLWRISRKRAILWWILGMSSLPLHLFYNSAVFSSISANSFTKLEVNKAFETSQNWTVPTNFRGAYSDMAKHLRGSVSKLDNLTVSQCTDAYAQNFVTKRSNLLLVIDNVVTANPSQGAVLNYGTQTLDLISDPYEWICSQDGKNSYYGAPGAVPCSVRLSKIRSNSSGWQPMGKKVEYCLSETVTEHCKLQFSIHLAVTVIILNIIKGAVMFYLAFGIKENPLMTMGDAVSSFLERSDPTTDNMCLASKAQVKKMGKTWLLAPQEFKLQPRRWFCAASVKRWATCLTMFTVALAVVIFLLWFSIASMLGGNDAAAIWRLGVGAISPLAFISWGLPSQGANGLVLNVIMANLAQPILSFLYFTYNGLFTCMFLALEWSLFATQRKGLRVSSSPVGAQRTTYFLQLPYRYALPLMGLSGLLHWLVSQSIFLVSVESWEFDSGKPEHNSADDFMSCGYSPLAIIWVVVVGHLMVFSMIGMAMRKFRRGMPVAGSCSAAISAACHPKPEVENAAYKPVQWGYTGTAPSGIAHTSFSAGEVWPPQEAAQFS